MKERVIIMKKLLTTIIAALVSVSVQADIVSYNFHQNNGANGSNVTGEFGLSDIGDGTSSVTDTWQNVGFLNAAVNIIDDGGAVTGLDLYTTRPNSPQSGVDNSGDSTNYDGTPMRGFMNAYANNSGSEAHIRGVGLSAWAASVGASEYSVIAWLGGQSQNTASEVSFTAGNEAAFDAGNNTTTYLYRTRFNPNASGAAGYNSISDLKGVGASSTYTSVGDYAVYTFDASVNVFTVTVDAIPTADSPYGTTGASGLGGIQIVAIPEPATLGFMGIAGSGLLFLRKRFGLNS
jgi:hypothetical protein